LNIPVSTRNHGEQLLLLLSFLGFMVILGQWWNVYEFNPDEGVNLQKAALIANNFSLYSEIWSDQPPVFTYVLSFVQRIAPFSVIAARAAVLLFSAILVVSLFRIVLRFEGRTAAWASVFVLVSGMLFLTLSVTVMIGLPAIAFAIVAIDIVTGGSGRSVHLQAIIGGIVFALALCTKLFVLPVLPVVLIATWIAARHSENSNPSIRRNIEIVALLMVSAGLSVLGIGLATGMFQPDQLIEPHSAARNIAKFTVIGGVSALFSFLDSHSTIALYFGTIGLFFVFIRWNASRLMPIIWLVVAILILSKHRPLWFHQTLLVVIPLCWIGGIAIAAMIRTAPQVVRFIEQRPISDNQSRIISAGAIIGLLSFGIGFAWDNLSGTRARFMKEPSIVEQQATERLSLFLNNTEKIVTDKPIDAYRQARLVPPELAVWTSKRRAVGSITDDEVLTIIASSTTSQVSLRRFRHDTKFLRKIGELLPPTGLFSGVKNQRRYRHFAPKIGIPADQWMVRRGFDQQTEPVDKNRDLAIQLLQRMPSLGANGLGGIWDNGNNRRFDRVQSSRPLPDHSIVARPPGSVQELGACFLAVWDKTGYRSFLKEALDVGENLACTQTRTGGWKKASVVPKNCPSPGGYVVAGQLKGDLNATFDDGTVTAALYFAFDLQDAMVATGLEIPRWLEPMIGRGLSFVENTQNPDGSWPQSLSSSGYHPLPTLNDDVMTGLIRLVLRAYQRDNDPDHIASARRGGDYLLSVQGPDSQPAFAQQYSLKGQPAAARKFEPAAYSSLETAYAINALVDLFLVTSEERFRTAAKRAADWLKQSQVSPGRWARFYEIGTNSPIFSDREGNRFRRIEDLPEEERNTYRWLGGWDVFPDIGTAIERTELIADGKEAVRRYDIALESSALLPSVPTARILFKIRPPNHNHGSLVSSRRFAEDCASLLAQLHETTAGEKKAKPQSTF